MFKKFFIYFITLLFIQNFLVADRLDDIKTSGVLKAGVKHDFEPFGFKNSDGEIVGFDIDLLQYIATDLKVKLKTQQVTSKNRIEMVQNNTVDIVAVSMTHKKSRDKTIDFTISYFFDGQALLTRKYCKKRKATGFNGKEVGAIEGATSGINLKKIAPKVGLTPQCMNLYFYKYCDIISNKGIINANSS
jgi:polar amino acid transport system substrate-binding protein